MAAHSRPITDFLTRTEILTENSESAAPEPPQKQIPLSPDAAKREHENTILYKEVSDCETGMTCSIFLASSRLLLIKLATCIVTFGELLNWSGQPQLLICCE